MKLRYDKENEEFVVSEATRTEYHQMSLWLTRKVKGYKFMPAFKMGVWNGDQTYFRNGKINLGLWKEALKGCQEIGVPFIIENKEDFPLNKDITLEKVHQFCQDFFKNHMVKNKNGEWIKFYPYEHQIQTAYKILKNRYCMAEVATSGGKSLIISIVIFYTLKHIKADAKFLLIVPSITLVTQFYDDILNYYYSEKYLTENKYDYNIEIELNNGTNLIKKPDEKIKTKKGEINAEDLKESDVISSTYKIKNIRKVKMDEPLKIEEVMSEKPRKYSGKENANIYIGTYQSLEKWPKEFFQQFHTIITDEAHGAKNNTTTKILTKTFKYAYSRFGVSGTFPPDESCEILSLESLLGPKITEVSASELKEKGIITPMEIKAVIINHQNEEFNDRIKQIRKAGMGKEALNIEKNYIHLSDKRLDLIKKITSKFDENSLILFHTIEYGQKMLNYLSEQLPDKEFYYIDGEVSGKRREEIKKLLEIPKENVEYTILNFGDYEIELKSDFKIKLTDGTYKIAKEITSEDDISDDFVEKYKKIKKL